MKGLKISLLFVAAALMITGAAGTSYAFHDGGVATCEGCHTMHNSINGSVVGLDRQSPKILTGTLYNAATQYLLKGSDQSSTCLNCHRVADTSPNGYHIMSGASGNGAVPVERTPGGDFAWLLVNGVNTTGGVTNRGNHHGHNIVAADFGLAASTNYAANGNVSPGGNYPVANLYCNSCHDPHSAQRIDGTFNIVSRTMGAAVDPIAASGSYAKDDGTGPADTPVAGQESVGVYRFLGGVGYQPKSVLGVASAFTNQQPFAFAPSTYNAAEGTGQVKVAYGNGMSEWCGNCHAGLVNNAADPSVTHRHPAGAAALLNNATGNEMNIYNAYVKSGDLTGNSTNAYLSLVPFERGITLSAAGWTQLASYASGTAVTTGTSVQGPDTASNVMCLSCHRAHATGFQFGTKWDANGGQYITMNDVYIGTDNWNTAIADTATAQRVANNIGYTTGQVQAAYYDRAPTQFASFQRSLCNKCHAKD